jgi:isopenicillin-N N-acyltransferase-like protein
MLGELTKGGCSMYGAWGNAVNQTNSQLMQLRALDWDVDGPFKVRAPCHILCILAFELIMT